MAKVPDEVDEVDGAAGDEAPEVSEPEVVEAASDASALRAKWTYYSAVWKTFELDDARQAHARVFAEIRGSRPVLEVIEDAEALIRILRDETETYDRKDAILLALIAAFQAQRSNALFSLLARAMLPKLDRVYKSRAYHMNESALRDDLCSRLFVAFAETLSQYPLRSWLTGVAQNLAYNTITRLRATEKSNQRESEALAGLRLESEALLAEQESSGDESPRGLFDQVSMQESEPAPPEPQEIEAARSRLDSYVRERRLAPDDARLLLEVCALDRPIADVASELRVPVETVKRRKSRALLNLRSGRIVRCRKRRS